MCVSDVCRADGWRFDHRALVASHRRASTRNFLEAFRHSQMYEVFVTERLQLAANNWVTKDAFEAKIVSRDVANRRSKQIKNLVSVGAKGVSKGVAMLQRAGHSVKVGAICCSGSACTSQSMICSLIPIKVEQCPQLN